MKSILNIFKKGLQKTKTSILRGFESLFTGTQKWDATTYRKLEESLIRADLGVNVTMRLTKDIKDRYERGEIKTADDIIEIGQNTISEILETDNRPIIENPDGPTVILMVGVNGSGKTTTTGKLAWKLKQEGKKVMLAACDTFRAAATEQLKLWGERVDCPVVHGQHGSDAAAIAFDATKSAMAKGMDYLIIDTAGRQHTRADLMEELPKILRTIRKNMPDAPHEVILVVDGSTGTNAMIQARQFGEACGVTGLAVTKLDGTGKGGVVVAIKDEKNFPIHYVGLGEQPEDLQPFDARMFAEAIFSRETD
ncbi:MAG: signal recognition particle-docking protein FtsY [Lentisphaerales bacterium]|nr:signal recognition particle-docking protein FtsY [Lentisphaerales bacterium]